MVILFILDSFQIGGVTTFVNQYTQVLKDAGHKIYIMGLNYDLENPQKFFSNCEVIIIPDKYGFGLFNRLKNLLPFYKELSDLYKKENIDVVHFSTTWSAIYSLLHIKTWAKKKIMTFYGAYDLEVLSDTVSDMSLFGKILFLIKNRIRKALQFFVFAAMDRIVTFSQYSRNLIITHFSKFLSIKIFVVPGFVNIHSVPRKNNDNKEYVILNFGRAEPRKGIDLLLQAVKKLSQAKIKCKLIIASPVDYWLRKTTFEEYERLNLFDVVHFIHKIDFKQKVLLLKQADVFVMPSRDLETFGMTILESLAYGVPVIGTPVGAIPEILSLFDKKFICSDISTESIYRKLFWYYKLTSFQKNNYRRKAIETCKKYFSIRKIAPRILRTYLF